MWESENHNYDILNSNKHDVKTDGFLQKGHSWHVSSEIPSDLLVQVCDVSFHLHKFPLISRSGKLNRIIYKSRNPDDVNKVVLDDLPGGSIAFELASKFSYGIPIDLTASNASSLRCAAEYLEMTEDLEEGNLIYKTEAFISYVVLSSWKDSITVLKSCENLSPWADDLQIVRRCSDSIAWKACANTKSIKWAYSNSTATTSGAEVTGQDFVPQDWWFEDVATLRIDHFVRVITSIKVKGVRVDLIGSSIVHYATKWLPGMTIQKGSSSIMGNDSISICTTNASTSTSNDQSKFDQKTIIESLISILPSKKNSVSCTFLLRLLKMATMFKVAHALINELEKKIGMQFEQATVADLLITLFGSSKNEGLYDTDLVQRLVEHFLVQEQMDNMSPAGFKTNSLNNMFDQHDNHEEEGLKSKSKMKVAKIVDSYLSEVSKDGNLSLMKFQVLAEALPHSARSCDDGLYRAVDSYLKAHPKLSEHEKKRLCRVMDCKKLSVDACMHAAQNERLPLRLVLQVLFSKQVKISNAIPTYTTTLNTSINNQSPRQPKSLLEGAPQSFQDDWSAAKNDIDKLKFDIETVKTKYIELQNEMENLHRQFETTVNKQNQTSSGWGHGWKKLSKLTKLGHLESHEELEGEARNCVITTRKGPRRWRNLIS